MEKIDLTKIYRSLYSAGSKPELLFVPAGHYLSIDGHGDPDGKCFEESVQALYTAAYSVKQHYKKLQQDFTVCKLEGIWWVDEDEKDELSWMSVPREKWQWQLLIRMPDYMVKTAVKQVLKQTFLKKQLPYFSQVYLQTLPEGQCVQMLHQGAYAEEPATLKTMHDFMKSRGLAWNGRHHEIYLSDPRRTAPEKLRTILRQPVK